VENIENFEKYVLRHDRNDEKLGSKDMKIKSNEGIIIDYHFRLQKQDALVFQLQSVPL
jgi:hypothetical protein